MNPLHDCVARIADGGPVDTVFHVGPGDAGLLERYLALWPRQVVWVDDDAERTLALREAAAAAGAASMLSVLPECVDAQPGERQWQRFEVPAFDGPLPLREVAEAYPALGSPVTRRVRTRALQALLAPVLAARPEGARALVVLDQPGRELALLAGLSPDTLAATDTLVLRGCARPFFEGGSLLDETLASLGQRSWRVVAQGRGAPWWPAVALRFDPQVQAMADRLAASETARIAAEARADALAARLQAQETGHAARLQELETRHADRLAAEHAATVHAKEEVVRVAQFRDSFKARSEELSARLAETVAARDADRQAARAKLESELQRRDAELQRLKSELAAEHAAAERAREETARVAQFRDTFKARGEELSARLAESVAARDAALRDKSALAQQREKQTAALSEAQKQIHRLEGAAQEAAQRQRLLQESLAKAEGQLALLRDLLLRD